MPVERKENGIYVVRENLSLDRYSFDGTADEIKSYIDQIVERAESMGMVGEGCFDFDLDDNFHDIMVTYAFDRVETDKEKFTRESIEAKAKEEAAAKRRKAREVRKNKKEQEYAEYLRLKKKFENS